jgi:hypothetical protein
MKYKRVRDRLHDIRDDVVDEAKDIEDKLNKKKNRIVKWLKSIWKKIKDLF